MDHTHNIILLPWDSGSCCIGIMSRAGAGYQDTSLRAFDEGRKNAGTPFC